MNPRVLFVDDDPALLGTLQRNLCFTYDIVTAESGAAALDVIRTSGHFPVIVTDMRMPRMDGIEFIREARRISPDSIYVMLTGNQDVNTALQAVNDGHVFRFLNKPCETEAIRKAVDAALRQREMIQAERDLLQKTFVGAVNVMTDVVALLSPQILGESHEVDQIMRSCEEALGFTGNWEYRLSARLGLLGLVLLPNADLATFQSMSPANSECSRLIDRAATAAAGLIRHVPRLERVAEILRLHATTDGSALIAPIDSSDPRVPATLLRLAVHWATVNQQGMTAAVALGELHKAMPKLPTAIDATLLALEPDRTQLGHREVPLDKLEENMVLYENVLSDDGTILLREGRRLTNAIIEKLRLHCTGIRKVREIRVVAPNVPQEAPVAIH